MHQDHNIPWQTLSKNFAVVSKGDHSDLYPLNKPNQTKELKYFSNALTNTIQEFANTERQKYPQVFPIEESRKLYPDDLIENKDNQQSHTPYLTQDNQKLEYWISSARTYHEKYPDGYPILTYTTSDMDLASAVKYLIIKNQMSPLLMMACHTSVPLDKLYSLSWGHSFGWSRLIDYALRAYVYINIISEFPELCKGAKYEELQVPERLWRDLTMTCDGDSQIVMHVPFLMEPQDRPSKKGATQHYRDIFEDIGRLKEYLKSCFEALYRCEMLAKECGVTIEWEHEISYALLWLNVKSYI